MIPKDYIRFLDPLHWDAQVDRWGLAWVFTILSHAFFPSLFSHLCNIRLRQSRAMWVPWMSLGTPGRWENFREDDDDDDDDGDEIARIGQAKAKSRWTSVERQLPWWSSTKVPKASSRGGSPPACRSVEYFHERVGSREWEARVEAKQKEIWTRETRTREGHHRSPFQGIHKS